jgi:hypothetical protein
LCDIPNLHFTPGLVELVVMSGGSDLHLRLLACGDEEESESSDMNMDETEVDDDEGDYDDDSDLED